MKTISIVLPCHNEAGNLKSLHQALIGAQLSGYDYEYILVDDGSTDDTWQVVTSLGVVGIRLTRNFGHHAALEAGLRAARGDAVIMMDADFQHPPGLIPKLIESWEAGNKIVNTRRLDHRLGPAKQLSSRLFYAVFNAVSEIELVPGSADFRLIDRSVVDVLNEMPEREKFYRGLVQWVGGRHDEVAYVMEKRLNGASSYSWPRMFELARIGVTSFSMVPLQIILLFGVFLSLLSGAAFAVMLVAKYGYGSEIFSSAAIFGSFILFNNGILICLIGVVGLYLSSLHTEIRRRPTYLIAEQIDPLISDDSVRKPRKASAL